MSIEQIAEQLLSWAQAKGAQADLIVERKRDFSVMVSAGAVEKQQASQSQIFGLRVLKEGKAGIAYSEATGEQAMSRLLENALVSARFATPDAHQTLVTSGSKLSSPGELVQTDRWSLQQKLDKAVVLEAALLAHKEITSVPYNSLGEHNIEKYVFNTAGLQATHNERVAYAYVAPIAKVGDANAMLSQSTAGRHFDELAFDRLIKQGASQVIELASAKSLTSGRYDVVFATDKLSSMLGYFLAAASAKAVKDGVSPWQNQLQQGVASELLTVIDDPLNQQGLGFRTFDDEGYATQRTMVIEQGVLKHYLHNQTTANYLGQKPTGNGIRGARGNANVGWHQLSVAPGEATAADVQQGDYLEITDLTGLHSGANVISGDFSFGASGYLCRNGERLHAVRGFTLAGNFYQMLRQQLACISQVGAWTSQRSAWLPSIRWTDVAISG